MVVNAVSPSLAPPADIRVGPFTFGQATTPDDFEQIHRLNHATFVDEIRQHQATGDGRLVDKFHDKNLYFVAKRSGSVIGMVSVHDRPPFSVASKLADPSVLASVAPRPLEVRLLAVRGDDRHSVVFAGLGFCLLSHARRAGYSHLVISGFEQREKLYRHLGFSPIGPPVESGEARFIPMVLDVSQPPSTLMRTFVRLRHRLAERHARRGGRPSPAIWLTPGPVQISGEVRRAYRRPPIYHRSPKFLEAFEDVRASLSRLTGAPHVAMFTGSATLANDAVAATLAADPTLGHGVVLVNGEFGERLVRQAERAGLKFAVVRSEWGRPWDLAGLRRVIDGGGASQWIWGTHIETSTGVLNDIDGLLSVAPRARVCLDATSSLGAVPVDLRRIHLASSASGKALGSFAGLSFVFASDAAVAGSDGRRVPTVLDVGATVSTRGPRFTVPSAPLIALKTALDSFATAERAEARFALQRRLGTMIRDGLRSMGISPLADDRSAAPPVTTFARPFGDGNEQFVRLCRRHGFHVGGQSGYLSARHLVQVATMGDVQPEHVDRWLGVLTGAIAGRG
ncbi:MAG: aminotransferase class V-fold PLP-dependent enzyme [Phycisphaerales bacterium]|nr:aminotransferase class V-fold PLP-dependent enzyme [Phycisphaerales bacterium]